MSEVEKVEFWAAIRQKSLDGASFGRCCRRPPAAEPVTPAKSRLSAARSEEKRRNVAGHEEAVDFWKLTRNWLINDLKLASPAAGS